MRDLQNSNVVQFLAMLRKDDPKKQLVYYQVILFSLCIKAIVLTQFRQAGIGTYTSNVLKTQIIETTSKLVDAMIAWNMPEHIKGLSTPHVPLPTVPDKSFQMATTF